MYGRRTAVLDAVKRASARAAIAVHAEMKRGLNSLASIAATAPLVGVFGTLLGIVNSFPALGTEKWTAFAVTTGRLSESLVPTELGLLAAVIAFCGHKYLMAKMADFDVEMENASFPADQPTGVSQPLGRQPQLMLLRIRLLSFRISGLSEGIRQRTRHARDIQVSAEAAAR